MLSLLQASNSNTGQQESANASQHHCPMTQTVTRLVTATCLIYVTFASALNVTTGLHLAL